MKKKKTSEELRTRFNTRLKCLNELLAARMSEDKLCFIPGCKAEISKFYTPLNKSRGFLCKCCLNHIHPTVDSIFNKTKIELSHWFEITYKMLVSRNSISANEVFRDYPYGQNSVFYMMHDIRSWMADSLEINFSNQVIEVDESYIPTGYKGHNRHYHFKTGRGSERMSSILVIKARGGGLKLIKIPDASAETLESIILKYISKDSIVITDQWDAYGVIAKKHGYTHYVVNHDNKDKSKRYVDGIASTNNAENIFSWFKRAMKGTYIHISDTYLSNYLAEIAFRLTYKDEEDYGFGILMKNLSSLSVHYGKKSAA